MGRGEVVSALLEAMETIGGLANDRTNKHAGYDYTSERAVKQAVQPALIDAGVMHDGISFEVLSDTWTAGGKSRNLIKVLCTIRFGDKNYSGLGAGIDYADKALMAAQTAAVREAWKNVFCIPTGGDPEEPNPAADRPHEPEPAPQELTHESKLPKGDHQGKRLVDCPAEYLEQLGKGEHEWGAAARKALVIVSAKEAGFEERS